MKRWLALAMALDVSLVAVVATATAPSLQSELAEVSARLRAMGDRVVSEREWNEFLGRLTSLEQRARAAQEWGIVAQATLVRAQAWGQLRRDPSRAVEVLRAARQEAALANLPETRALYVLEAEMLARLGDEAAIRRLMTAYRASPLYDPPPFAFTAVEDRTSVVAMTRPRSPETESPVLLAMHKYLEQARAVPGVPFPSFSFPGVDGLRYMSDALRGRVVLVDFWVAGSVPWERELNFRVRAREKFRSQGFEILGICQNLEGEALRAYLAQHPEISWPQIEGRQARELILRLGIPGEVASYLLDRRVRIRARNLPGSALSDAIARLLAEPLDIDSTAQ